MFNEEFTAASKGAVAKATLLKKNPAGYFLLSVLAGAYIGFGILLVFTLSGALDGAPYTKLVMGCCFGVALSLVNVRQYDWSDSVRSIAVSYWVKRKKGGLL
jgi:nitrite transporter NirC